MKMNLSLTLLSLVSVALMTSSDSEYSGGGSANSISTLKDLLNRVPQPISYEEKIEDKKCIQGVIELISNDKNISSESLQNIELKKAVWVMNQVFTAEEKQIFITACKDALLYYKDVLSRQDKIHRPYLQPTMNRAYATSEFDNGASILRERLKVQKPN